MKRLNFGKVVGHAVLAFAALAAVTPVLWTLVNSFKNRVDIATSVPRLVFSPTLENYVYVLSRDSAYDGLLNSLIVSGLSVLIGAVLGLPAAYALARYPGRCANDIQFFLPPVAVAIPLMVIWLGLGLYDTKVALIATYAMLTLSCTIWLAVPAFKRVPREIEEAAIVDGYDKFAVFFLIALPVAARSLMASVAFSFVLVWNEFLIALMLTTSDAKTLPIVASELTQLGRDVPWGILNASVILLSLPPILLIGVLNGLLNSSIKKKG
jgi:multiple sugar transport system permease protein